MAVVPGRAGEAKVDEISLNVILNCRVLRQDPPDVEGGLTYWVNLFDLWSHCRGLVGIGLQSESFRYFAQDMVYANNGPNSESVCVVLLETWDLIGPNSGHNHTVHGVPVGLVILSDL